MNTNKILLEAPEAETRFRHFMSDRERKVKKKLIALLRDDGRGHHHAKYAERLEKFDIQIVPLSVDPEHTASISFDDGIITISEGFLTDPSTFFQLPVIMRHELAHNLLMHQIRMAYKLGESVFIHTGLSRTLHMLYNHIMDDEISNRKYSEDDKSIMRNLILNGQLIHCLVTEDHRPEWIHMTIEEMYDQICAEIAEIQEKLRGGMTLSHLRDRMRGDSVKSMILDTYIYSDTKSSSMIRGSLGDFIAKGCSDGKGKWQERFRNIAEKIFDRLTEGTTDSDLDKLFDKITKSSPVETLDLFDDESVVLYTPEDKYVAVEILKKFKSEYREWYDKVMGSLTELDDAELKELLDFLK